MFRTIKRIKEMNEKTEKLADEVDESGLRVINMTVRDDSNFISPFSYSDEPILSEECASFIGGSLKPKNFKDDVHLKIHSNVIDEEEKVVYESAIRKYFEVEYVKEKQKSKRHTFISIIMMLCGVFLLALLVLLDSAFSLGIWLEIIDIVAWVFLWESADIFFFERYVSRWNQHKNITLYKAKISFYNM